ncbi:MAG: hypothetical protein ABIH39_04975, partial [Candidatus Margulisiibacteriota bacterium]
MSNNRRLPTLFIFFFLLLFSLNTAAKNTIVNSLIPELELSEEEYYIRMENVVNLKTTGYKELKSITVLDDDANRKTIFYRNYSDGPMLHTKQKLDFAIEGSGFFVLQTPMGNAYTRDGRFIIDREGNLLSRANLYPVLGESGPIAVPNTEMTINQSGELYKDDERVGRFLIVGIINIKDLTSVNGVLFFAPLNKPLEFSIEEDYKIRQG